MARVIKYTDLDDDDILQAATQFSWSDSDSAVLPRPTKRRRLHNETNDNGSANQRGNRAHSGVQANGSEDLLASDGEESEAFDPPQPSKSPARLQRQSNVQRPTRIPDTSYGNKKSKASIHVPKHTEQLKDSFSTQLPPSSHPWTVRGPVWQKKPQLPPQKGNYNASGHEDSTFTSNTSNEEGLICPSVAHSGDSFEETNPTNHVGLKDRTVNASDTAQRATALRYEVSCYLFSLSFSLGLSGLPLASFSARY